MIPFDSWSHRRDSESWRAPRQGGGTPIIQFSSLALSLVPPQSVPRTKCGSHGWSPRTMQGCHTWSRGIIYGT